MSHPPPPKVADERTMLDAWLDRHRETLLWKCEGLTDDQLRRRAVPPSSLSLLGLVRHMSEVERGWFASFAGADASDIYCSQAQPEEDFHGVDDADVMADFAIFRAEIDSARRLVAQRSLDETEVLFGKEEYSLRWIMVHMIEEYARHNGHADLLREGIDGVVGDFPDFVDGSVY
jgi:uncharacterized damage-inducible protein DinB